MTVQCQLSPIVDQQQPLTVMSMIMSLIIIVIVAMMMMMTMTLSSPSLKVGAAVLQSQNSNQLELPVAPSRRTLPQVALSAGRCKQDRYLHISPEPVSNTIE